MADETTPLPPPPPGGGRDSARAARAEAKAAKAHAKAMRPWYKKKRFIIPLGFVALIVIIAAVGGGAAEDDTDVASGGGADTESPATEASDQQPDTFSGNSDNPPQGDVTLADCSADQFGFMEATLDVVNNSSGQSNYWIEVTFESSDGSQQLGTGIAVINNLEPGQRRTETASALEEAPANSDYTCRVTDVNRVAS